MEDTLPIVSRNTDPLGQPADWGKDFAILGGVSPAMALLSCGFFHPLLLTLVPAVGAGVGYSLGRVLPRLLSKRWATVPITLLFIPMALFGLLWGGAMGLASAAVVAPPFVVMITAFCALCGMVQLGWFWLPYTYRKAGERSPAPLLALATAVAFSLPWVAGAALNVLM